MYREFQKNKMIEFCGELKKMERTNFEIINAQRILNSVHWFDEKLS